jgi:uncharacterized protein (TIGR00730 family)
MNVCVYCSASERIDQKFKSLAYDVGQYMAQNKYALVFGGGCLSMMGALSSGVVENGGYAIGFIPEHLKGKEGENTNIQELHIVDSMHTRKLKMSEKSDAFLILPGGFGTLDEFFEIMTWKQIGIHNKPIIILNAFGYWTHLITLMNNIIDHEFAHPDHRGIFNVIGKINQLPLILGQTKL